MDSQPGLGILTGKADLNDSDPDAVNPGGVPLFKKGVVVGGVGVAGVSPDVAEFAAFSGAVGAGFGPDSRCRPGVVIIDGIALPFVNQTTHARRISRQDRRTATYVRRSAGQSWAARPKAIWSRPAPDPSAADA